MLDVGQEVRNEILYVLAARPPVQVFVAKAVTQYVRNLTSHPRLVTSVVRGVRRLDLAERDRRRYTCLRMEEVAS